MDITVHIFLDNERHVSWVYNLQAEAEQLLGLDLEDTGYEADLRRRDWFLKGVDPSTKTTLESFLKDQGARYEIKEQSHDDPNGGT